MSGRLVIEISGGCLTSVRSDQPLDLQATLADWDEIEDMDDIPEALKPFVRWHSERIVDCDLDPGKLPYELSLEGHT